MSPQLWERAKEWASKAPGREVSVRRTTHADPAFAWSAFLWCERKKSSVHDYAATADDALNLALGRVDTEAE